MSWRLSGRMIRPARGRRRYSIARPKVSVGYEPSPYHRVRVRVGGIGMELVTGAVDRQGPSIRVWKDDATAHEPGLADPVGEYHVGVQDRESMDPRQKISGMTV